MSEAPTTPYRPNGPAKHGIAFFTDQIVVGTVTGDGEVALSRPSGLVAVTLWVDAEGCPDEDEAGMPKPPEGWLPYRTYMLGSGPMSPVVAEATITGIKRLIDQDAAVLGESDETLATAAAWAVVAKYPWILLEKQP